MLFRIYLGILYVYQLLLQYKKIWQSYCKNRMVQFFGSSQSARRLVNSDVCTGKGATVPQNFGGFLSWLALFICCNAWVHLKYGVGWCKKRTMNLNLTKWSGSLVYWYLKQIISESYVNELGEIKIWNLSSRTVVVFWVLGDATVKSWWSCETSETSTNVVCHSAAARHSHCEGLKRHVYK